jgi:hypothetical protein
MPVPPPCAILFLEGCHQKCPRSDIHAKNLPNVPGRLPARWPAAARPEPERAIIELSPLRGPRVAGEARWLPDSGNTGPVRLPLAFAPGM